MKLSRNRAQSHYDCPAVGPWVLVSFCLESDKCLEPLELSALHRRKKLYSWPQVPTPHPPSLGQLKSKCVPAKTSKTIRFLGGILSPCQCQKLKRKKQRQRPKESGKYLIKDDLSSCSTKNIQLEGQSRKPDEALELFCNRWVPSEDIIWLDNTTRPFFQWTAGFYGSLTTRLSDPQLSRSARLHNFHRMWSWCRLLCSLFLSEIGNSIHMLAKNA